MEDGGEKPAGRCGDDYTVMLFAFYRSICYSENMRDTIMSFMDELNKNTRTPEQMEE